MNRHVINQILSDLRSIVRILIQKKSKMEHSKIRNRIKRVTNAVV